MLLVQNYRPQRKHSLIIVALISYFISKTLFLGPSVFRHLQPISQLLFQQLRLLCRYLFHLQRVHLIRVFQIIKKQISPILCHYIRVAICTYSLLFSLIEELRNRFLYLLISAKFIIPSNVGIISVAPSIRLFTPGLRWPG